MGSIPPRSSVSDDGRAGARPRSPNLTPEVRRSAPNPFVRTEAIGPDPRVSTVKRVSVFSARILSKGKSRKRCMPRRRIVALGASISCALLMRSEIESSQSWRSSGIAVHADFAWRSARNLMEHR